MDKSAMALEVSKSQDQQKDTTLGIVADAVLLAATILVEGGCETKLAEDSSSAFGSSYENVDECTTFVMLTGIMVSVVAKDVTVTRIARLDGVSHNIWATDRVIALQQQCEKQAPEPQDLLARLQEVRKGPHFSPAMLGIAAALGSVGFAIFYGITSLEALICVAVIAFVTQLSGHYASNLLPNSSLTILVQALLATAACCLCQRLWALGIDKLLIPVLMLLVPGMTLATGILDTLSGNFLSATARFGKALLVGIAIAIGSAVVLHYTGVLSWSLS